MTTQLRGGYTTEDPRLDRLPWFDEESREYPVRALMAAATPTLQTRIWHLEEWFDQGQEGACVGFGITHEFAAEPDPVEGLTDEFARTQIYWEAQKIDPWDGGAYPGAEPFYEGTAVLAGMKVAHQLGYITEYRWAFGIDDVLATLSNLGPVVFGVHWYEGMGNPDADGFIRPTGAKTGGHAICGIGYDHEAQFVWLHNSWGREWGVDGRAKITVSDLAQLLEEQGECAVPLVRRAATPVGVNIDMQGTAHVEVDTSMRNDVKGG